MCAGCQNYVQLASVVICEEAATTRGRGHVDWAHRNIPDGAEPCAIGSGTSKADQLSFPSPSGGLGRSHPMHLSIVQNVH